MSTAREGVHSRTGTTGVLDGHLALPARTGDAAPTGDTSDLRRPVAGRDVEAEVRTL